MGIIAFIRQSYYDAEWYRKAQEAYAKDPAGQKRPETNTALMALADALQRKAPFLFDVNTDLNFLRVAKIAKEFSLNTWILGSGYEYRRLEAIKTTKIPVIVPVNFPEAPTVDTPEEAMNVTLEELRHYDAAPENAGRLQNAGIPIALTSAQLKDPGTFLAQARKAVERGLNADAALASLTTTPAQWLGVDKEAGTIEAGKLANILVTDGDLFAEKTKVQEVWIDGKRYEVKSAVQADVRGIWDLRIDSDSGRLTLRGDAEKPTGTIHFRGRDLRLSSVTFDAGRFAATFPGDSVKTPGTVRMSAPANDKEMFGILEAPDGSLFDWKATRKERAKEEPDTAKSKKPEMATSPITFPPTDFGRTKLPDQPENLLVKNATIWTQGPQGRLQNADMLVTKGKIVRVGQNLTAPKDALVIDGTGKHVSPGIIDSHSHTAIAGGVNEGGQAITCEARIEDVLDSDDIWIYRQLAGGTTAANVLHGSANPIGGQNAIVKWRWGSVLEDLRLTGAPPGVKFALGENVKQSNFATARGSSTRSSSNPDGC